MPREILSCVVLIDICIISYSWSECVAIAGTNAGHNRTSPTRIDIK